MTPTVPGNSHTMGPCSPRITIARSIQFGVKCRLQHRLLWDTDERVNRVNSLVQYYTATCRSSKTAPRLSLFYIDRYNDPYSISYPEYCIIYEMFPLSTLSTACSNHYDCKLFDRPVSTRRVLLGVMFYFTAQRDH